MIVNLILHAKDCDDVTVPIQTLHARGGHKEYDIACSLCKSNVAKEKVLGADVLSQLGCGDKRFAKQSIPILMKLLSDDRADVLETAVYALGHLEAVAALPHLLELKYHKSAEVREAVAYALGVIGVSTGVVVDSLIELSRDRDKRVRNWATFGLGSQLEDQSSNTCKALTDRLRDDNYEVRGEAITGLVRRNHPGMINYMKQWLDYEIENEDVLLESLEAAELFASPSIYTRLLAIKDILSDCADPDLLKQLNGALKACHPDGKGERRT